MKSISSRDNAFYKELKLLASNPQACRKACRTFLDGVHLCEVYIQRVGLPSLCIVNESSLTHPEIAPIVEKCEAGRTQCVSFPDALYRTLSQVEHGIGLLFVIDTFQADMPLALTSSAVLLDSLQDPGNLGSILRSAAAAGIQYVFCSNATTFTWSPKVLRAGMGAHFSLNIFENVDLLALMQSAKIPVLATSSHSRQTLYEANLRGPVGWLFGHEGRGVAPELFSLATERIAIPHQGSMESLNVAASAAICFFEQVRQQRWG